MTSSDGYDQLPTGIKQTAQRLVEGIAVIHDHLELTLASVIAPESGDGNIKDFQVMLVCPDFDGHSNSARLLRIKSLIDSSSGAAALRALTPAQWHLFTPEEALTLSEDFDEEPSKRGTSWH